jgi:hypothetical protein
MKGTLNLGSARIIEPQAMMLVARKEHRKLHECHDQFKFVYNMWLFALLIPSSLRRSLVVTLLDCFELLLGPWVDCLEKRNRATLEIGRDSVLVPGDFNVQVVQG